MAKACFVTKQAVPLHHHKERKIMKAKFTEKAIQMVIMDQIEKGHTDTKKLIKFMATQMFENQVANYVKMFEAEFGN